MPSAIRGISIVFGAAEPKPIVNIPQDAKRVRLRLRNNLPGVAFVKFADRIERWVLQPENDNWKLGLLQGVNKTA